MPGAPTKTGPRPLHYLAAVGLSALGLGFAFLFRGLRGVPDGLVFAATIAITARFFGLGPALFASGLCVILIDWTALPPLGRIEFTHPEELTYLIVFLVLSLVISGTTHSLRSARSSAESHVKDLEEANRQIAVQVEETRIISEHLAQANEELTAARDAAERVAMRANRLLAVTSALSEARLPSDVAHVVIGQGFDVLEAVAGMIAVVDGDRVNVLDRRRPPRATVEPSQYTLADDTPLAAALRKREPIWLESVEQYRERFPRAAERFRPELTANAVMALPLLDGEQLVGGLVLGFDQKTALGATDHAFAGLLAQAVGGALGRARTFEREREGRRDAELLSRAREEVLGIVAHDLRNPLSATGAVLQLLSDGQLPRTDRERLVGAGKRSIQQMNRLIGDLLDVMRLEAGRLALDMEDLSVAAIFAQADESTRHLAEERHIELTIAAPDASLRVRGDRGRLAQVFSNLLGNAIKFTPEGGKVTLHARRDEREIVFEVTDTGVGLSKEQLTHLFDRFWQASRGDRRGVGLGLPIAKGIVDAHGGRIWAESQIGAGSRFFVALPASS